MLTRNSRRALAEAIDNEDSPAKRRRVDPGPKKTAVKREMTKSTENKIKVKGSQNTENCIPGPSKSSTKILSRHSHHALSERINDKDSQENKPKVVRAYKKSLVKKETSKPLENEINIKTSPPKRWMVDRTTKKTVLKNEISEPFDDKLNIKTSSSTNRVPDIDNSEIATKESTKSFQTPAHKINQASEQVGVKNKISVFRPNEINREYTNYVENCIQVPSSSKTNYTETNRGDKKEILPLRSDTKEDKLNIGNEALLNLEEALPNNYDSIVDLDVPKKVLEEFSLSDDDEEGQVQTLNWVTTIVDGTVKNIQGPSTSKDNYTKIDTTNDDSIVELEVPKKVFEEVSLSDDDEGQIQTLNRIKTTVDDMDELECPICYERFNASSHRPRNLPCGHGFCTSCINTNINKGSRSCPICRKKHKAYSASDLPVSFLLEELVHNSTNSSFQKYNPNSENEEEEAEMCSKHKKIPVYFHCKTHNIKVCHSCAVLAHKPTSCDLISLEDQLEEKKNDQIVNIQKQKQVIKNAERYFKLEHKENTDELSDKQKRKQNLEKEIQKAILEMDELQQDITKKEKCQGQIEVAIRGCQEIQKSFEIMANELKSVRSYPKFEAECKNSTSAIMKSQKWEEMKRKKYNANKKAKVNNLESEKTKTNNVQEAELYPNFSTTWVFLDLSSREGCNLGRIEICVLTDRPEGKQFVSLACGTEGRTYKGASFDDIGHNCISLREYVTKDNGKAKAALVTMKEEHHGKVIRGRLFTCDVNEGGFVIMKKDYDVKFPGYFGDVVTGFLVVDNLNSNSFVGNDIVVSDCGKIY